MSRRRFLSLVPKLAAFAAAPAFVRNAQAQDGLSAKSVTIGCSCPLSGPLGGFGSAIKLGADAAIAQVNAKGGVQGRQLQLQLVDDAYAVQRTTDNVKKMIGDGSVFALMSCFGTPNNAAIFPMVEASNLPYLAPLTGAMSLRTATNRNVFHVRASYTEETQRLLQKILAMGIKDLGVVYLDNAFGKELLTDATAALATKGVQPTVQAALAADGKNLTDVVAQIVAAKPSAVLLGTAGAASVSLIDALRKAVPMTLLVGQSMTLSADDLKILGAAGAGVALTMLFPDPHRAKVQVVRDYQAAMRATGKEDFSLGSLESYINTRILIEALDRAGREVTRAKLRAALMSLQKFDLGGFSVDYSGAAPFVASRYVDMGVLGSNGRFVG